MSTARGHLSGIIPVTLNEFPRCKAAVIKGFNHTCAFPSVAYLNVCCQKCLFRQLHATLVNHVTHLPVGHASPWLQRNQVK